MEIQFLHEKAIEKDPKLLIDCIQKMGSGEAPFFPTTLSLIYDTLVEKAFTTHVPFDPRPSGRTEGKSPIRPPHSPQALTSTPNINASLTVDPATSSSNPQTPASTRDPNTSTTTTRSAWLKCIRCYEVARLQDLHGGLYCPKCPAGLWWGERPLMQCTLCNLLRTEAEGDCCRNTCRRRFM